MGADEPHHGALSRGELLALSAVLAVASLTALSAAAHWTPTSDEPRHLQMGLQILRTGDFSRFDNSKMPVSTLNAVGWVLAGGEEAPAHRAWLGARAPQLFWLWGVAGLVAWFGRRQAGPWAGVAAAALVAFDPNLLAHAVLVTTDLPITFFTLAVVLGAHRAMERGGPGAWTWVGLALGLAQAAKFTAVFLVPIVVVQVLVTVVARRSLGGLRGAWVAVPVAWLALDLAYGFQGVAVPASQVEWRSDTFRPLAGLDLPLGLPRAWLEGLDWVRADDDQGQGNIYLEGRYTPLGQDDYFLRALAWKLPFSLIFLPIAGLLRPRPVAELATLLVPLMFFLVWFSVAFNFQLGVRYVLPILPLLGLLAVRLDRRLVALGAAWSLASGLTWWPWTLSYFNERLVDRVDAWRHLADSNLDWGQADGAADAWRESTGGVVQPQTPVVGPMLVSANALTGVARHPAFFACLREHFPPKDHVAWAWYPFELSFDDLAPCGPLVELTSPGAGAVDAGERIVAMEVRREGTLWIDGAPHTGTTDDVELLLVRVRSAGPFGVRGTGEVFVDGVSVGTGDGGER